MELIKELLTGLDNSYRSLTFAPEGAIAFLTYRCTSRCKTCNIWRRPVGEADELGWEQWRKILENLARNRVKSIELFGGDALLRKDLLIEMVRFCKTVGIKTFLPTNSNLMDDETARALVEAGLGTIYFSLDEISSAEGSVRGVEGHFAKVDRSVRMVKKYRGQGQEPRIVCITTLSRLNYRQLDEFIKYVDSVPFDAYMLRGLSEFNDEAISRSSVEGVLPEPYFTSTTGSSNLFTRQEAQELLEKLASVRASVRKNGSVNVNMENMEVLTADDLVKGTYPSMKCQFCTTQLVITPKGDVTPCLYFNKLILGNLLVDDLGAVWGNARHRGFCSMQKSGKINICDYCSIKFYHKSFSSTVSAILEKMKKRLSPPRRD